MADMLLVWRMIGTRPGDCRDCCRLITCIIIRAKKHIHIQLIKVLKKLSSNEELHMSMMTDENLLKSI